MSSKPSFLTLLIADQNVIFPEWLKYFFDVGWQLGNESSGKKYRVVMTAPSRDLAGFFLNAGYLTSRSRRIPLCERSSEHFETLCAAAPRTQVTAIWEGNRYDRAIICGVCELSGERQVKVMLRLKDKYCVFFNKSRAHDVTITNERLEIIPMTLRGRQVQINDEFLAMAFGENEFKHSLMSNAAICEMFGYLNMYKDEMEKTEVVLGSDEGRSQLGKLKDIVRVKGSLNDGYGFLTELIGVNSNDLQEDVKARSPEVTIFDGAAGFLKWLDFRRGAHIFLLLDRSERLFLEAVDAVKNDYILNRKGENGLQVPIPPHGIETIVYYE
ncbi:MAG: hypothetical protein V1882_01185 [Candidatus Omnitrophota bacterium]